MKSSSKALAFATALTALHFAAKLAGGCLTNSLALISDAWHLLTDLLSLVLSWWALRISTLPPTGWATFGFHRVGTLAAVANNITLIVISFYILYEAYLRYMRLEPLEPMGMLGLAAGGIIASAVIAWLVNDGAKTNLNMRSVWLHFAGEALAMVSVGGTDRPFRPHSAHARHARRKDISDRGSVEGHQARYGTPRSLRRLIWQ
jgi:cobalt-zinc-cadmium efflux system protein